MDFPSTFFVILTIVISQTYSQVCTKRAVCECGELVAQIVQISANTFFCFDSGCIVLVFDDGSGYNLKLLVANDSYLEAKGDNTTFFFHPCGDTRSLPNINSTIENPCHNGYILCMYNQTANKMEVLGHEATMEFKMNGEIMEIIFVDPQSADPKYSVSLECTPKSKNNVLYASLDNNHDQVVS